MPGMGAPISIDVRERVVAAVHNGLTWQEATELFSVSIATVNRLMRLDRETGSVAPRDHGGGQRHRIPDERLAVLRELVDDRADATISELRVLYRDATKVDVSEATIGRALARLRLSRKKRASSTRSAQSRASKRRASRSEI